MVHTHDGKDNEISDVDRILLTETGKLKGYVALVKRGSSQLTCLR